MKKLVILLGVLLTQTLSAQNHVHQVLVLNEGYFDYMTSQIVEPVTIGTYDPITQVYSTIDTIDGARFASDMVVDGSCFYVAADNELHKYDINTYSLIATQPVPGIRSLTIYQDKILVSRGEYMTTYNSYLQIYSKIDLSFLTEFDTIIGPKWATQTMVVDGNTVYVAINNGFEWGNEKGLVGIIDMNTMTYMNEIDLGPDGTNPDNMVFDGTHIYTLNNKDFSGASISKVDIPTGTSITTNLSTINTGCGTSCLRNGTINYQPSGDTELYEWDPQFMATVGMAIGFTQNFYELAVDGVNDYLYASSTDWSTYGMVRIYDNNNTLVNTFACGISPGTIAFDVRSAVGINELDYENVMKGTIYDLFGRKLKSLENQPTGIYLVGGKKVYKR